MTRVNWFRNGSLFAGAGFNIPRFCKMLPQVSHLNAFPQMSVHKHSSKLNPDEKKCLVYRVHQHLKVTHHSENILVLLDSIPSMNELVSSCMKIN